MKRNLNFLFLSAILTFPLEAKEVALTFDDGPTGDGFLYSAEERTTLLIKDLKKFGVEEAVFFVNGENFERPGGRDQAIRFAKAGHRLGNHTYYHSNLRKVSLDKYLDDIRKGHDAIKNIPGFIPFFRYPHLSEGDTRDQRDRIRTELAELGYTNGYVTIDNYDFYMNTLAERASTRGDTIDFDKLGRVYVDVLLESANHYDQLAQEHLGKSPKHILLLHENDLAARFLGKLMDAFRKDGWKIIRATEAYEEPLLSRVPDTLYNGQGRIAALVHEKTRIEFRNRTENAEYLDKLFLDEKVFSTASK